MFLGKNINYFSLFMKFDSSPITVKDHTTLKKIHFLFIKC